MPRQTKKTEKDKTDKDFQTELLTCKIQQEANIIGNIYLKPEVFNDLELKEDDFKGNVWKTLFVIAKGILDKGGRSLDDVTVGTYLDEHKDIKKDYDKQGGWDNIEGAISCVEPGNLDMVVKDFRKYNILIRLYEHKFPVKEDYDTLKDMESDEILHFYEAFLEDVSLKSGDENIESYNAFEGLHDLIDELDKGEDVGLPFHNSPLLTNEVGGFCLNGCIYGVGAISGMGKSTMSFNYLLPSLIENNEKAVFIINEEDETKYKKELLVWVINNVILNKNKDKLFQKYKLRDGNFSDEDKELLAKAADWIEDKKDKHILTIIPLEHYTVNIAIKIIKKYSAALGVRCFVLDTLKESCDANDEIYKSMMRDMVKLYDVVKPKARNVGLLVTYQLGKQALKMRHLTNNEVGQAKSIIDVMTVNMMFRRPFVDEFEGGNKELKGYTIEGAKKRTKLVNKKLEKNKNYMITFITKNRRGGTDEKQIVSECDLSTNVYRDVFYCNVPQDW